MPWCLLSLPREAALLRCLSDSERLVAAGVGLLGDCLSLLADTEFSLEMVMSSRWSADFKSSASEVDRCFFLCLSPKSSRILVTLGQLVKSM